jgi:hypothetical protein
VGRRFESSLADHILKRANRKVSPFCIMALALQSNQNAPYARFSLPVNDFVT